MSVPTGSHRPKGKRKRKKGKKRKKEGDRSLVGAPAWVIEVIRGSVGGFSVADSGPGVTPTENTKLRGKKSGKRERKEGERKERERAISRYIEAHWSESR